MGMEDLSPEEQEFGYQYMSQEEIEEWDAGGDPCEHVLRIFI